MLDDCPDVLDRGNGAAGLLLHGGNLATDFLCGAASLIGEALHFVGDYGEAFAYVTGAGGFDGGLMGGGPHVVLMMLFGLVMVVLYLYVLALPWRGFKKALAAGDLATAAARLERIRVVVSVNLALGLVTAFIGAAGTFLGH